MSAARARGGGSTRRPERTVIGGVGLDPSTAAGTRRRIAEAVAAADRPPVVVATVNLDFLAIARRHRDFREVLAASDLAVPDGMAVVWLSRIARRPLPERISGSDLTEWLIDGGVPGARLYLLGSTPEVVDAVRTRASAGGVVVAGADTPGPEVFASDTASAELVGRVNGAGVDVVLVALGAPRQELWIDRWRDQLDASVAMGVGASLDFAAGKCRRAPEAWQRVGCEWLHRLLCEPRRLWRRYIARDLPFFAREAAVLALARARNGGARP